MPKVLEPYFSCLDNIFKGKLISAARAYNLDKIGEAEGAIKEGSIIRLSETRYSIITSNNRIT